MATNKAIHEFLTQASFVPVGSFFGFDSFDGSNYATVKILREDLQRELSLNIMNTDLTSNGIRIHDFNGFDMTFGQMSTFRIEASEAPSFTYASLDVKGYGTTSADVTQRFKSATGTIQEWYGNNESKVFNTFRIEMPTSAGGANAFSIRNPLGSILDINDNGFMRLNGRFMCSDGITINDPSTGNNWELRDVGGGRLLLYHTYWGNALDFHSFSMSAYHSTLFSTSFGVTDASSQLEIRSTTKGFLKPRQTTSEKEAISSPATGLEVWDTDADTTSYKKSSGWSYAGLITETIWNHSVASTITIADNAEINLFDYISDADINATVSDSFNQLSIDSTTHAIKTIWTGAKIIHNIRLSISFDTGNSQFYSIELRRQVDDSVISRHTVFRNPDEAEQTINIVTRTLSSTDPFVVDGFYLALVNNSGASTGLDEVFNLLIINNYQ